MIYMWFTGKNYYNLAVEKDHTLSLRPLRPHGSQALINPFRYIMPGLEISNFQHYPMAN
jgi:hypothetical protein